MIDRSYLRGVSAPNVKIKRMAFKIPIRGIGTQIHYSDEFAVLIFYFKKSIAITVINRELHIVNDLKIKMLLNIDIMSLKNEFKFRFPANDYWELSRFINSIFFTRTKATKFQTYGSL